jgi:hypothetical protein
VGKISKNYLFLVERFSWAGLGEFAIFLALVDYEWQ